MSRENRHTVAKLQIELQVNNEKKATEIQNQLSELCRVGLPEVFEKTFEQSRFKSQTFLIDRLEINLGQLGFDDFKTQFLSGLKIELESKLNNLELKQPQMELAVKSYTSEEMDLKILEYFLKTGSLPWFSKTHAADLFLIVKKFIRRKDKRLFELIDQNASNQYFVDRLADLIIKETYTTYIELNAKKYFINHPFEIEMFCKIFPMISIQNLTDIDRKKIVIRQLIFLSRFAEITEPAELELLLFRKIAENSDSNLLAIFKKMLKTLHSLKSQEVFPSEIVLKTAGLVKHLIKKIADTDEIKKMNEELTPVNENVESDTSGSVSYLIFNAGLVLLNPFLKEFFERLNLLKKDEFIDETARQKAIHVLQYTTSGKTGAPEYILLLNKILCGHPAEKPVSWNVFLTKKEKTETTKLLKSLIRHWSALKSTSVRTLRTNFLQRQGLLIKTENGWQLSVERSSYDLLLDRLPWQYRLVNLNWMHTELETIW